MTEIPETWNVGVIEDPDALITFLEKFGLQIQDGGHF